MLEQEKTKMDDQLTTKREQASILQAALAAREEEMRCLEREESRLGDEVSKFEVNFDSFLVYFFE